MNAEQLYELSSQTLNVVERLVNEVSLKNVAPDQEVAIVGNLAPVILQQLIDSTQNA